ncbi:probable amino acid permease 7 [Vigna unguiculata]|uniref:Solute carrier family 36 n=1 Tax=Vigna unguiculata TaxID=3917 RepID=A0A4D6MMF7_VIGUN|nr:probable amino acid permease 7 [Vigna unguiculata]QCE01881.1 solute carrier family 36 [Vigna unguiculata]
MENEAHSMSSDIGIGVNEKMVEALESSDNIPLLLTNSGSLKRTGTVWTAVAHIVTGVIGSGVLSLPWSTAQLGWLAGPLSVILIASITLFSSFLLCNTYRHPHPEHGPNRSASYLDVVHLHLGISNGRLSGLLVNISLYGFAIAFVITTAISLRTIQHSFCYHNEGSEASCEFADAYYMLLFGVIQIILSQIPNFHNIEWLSVVAAIMSFTYSFIGMGLSIAQIIDKGHAEGSIGGISTSSGTEKLWLVSQALGDISFSFPFSTIIMEIQDTLKSPPPENQTMKKASVIAVTVTTFMYLSCGGAGYAAFGDNTPGNLLTGFESSKSSYWLVNFANVCIVVHLVGSYQVYSQPLFATVESWFRFNFPDSEFMNHTYILKLPLLPAFELNFLSLTFRTAYVASTVVIAMVFPYFNQILGVLGSMIFWPLTIYFPVEIYLNQSSTVPWTTKWVLLRTFSIVGFVFGLFTLTGCIKGIVAQKIG